MSPITVLIADDHAIVRDSLLAVLKFAPDIVVCATARDGRRAVRLTMEHAPDVILMDIAMPVLNGIEATRQILLENPRAKVIVLSAHSEPAYVLRVIRAGAVGYLLKETSGEALADAIRQVHQGHAYFSPSVARHVFVSSDQIPQFQYAASPLATLSPRECEVIQLIAEGFTTKGIAGELGVSGKTVEKHRQRLMATLDIHNIAGLTRYAVTHGIIERNVVTANLAASA